MPKGFQKGNKLGTGRPRGLKNVATLLKEERRAIFEQRISDKWIKTIDKLRPEYVADQFMGKAPDKVEVQADLKVEHNLLPEVLDIAERELKKRLIDNNEPNNPQNELNPPPNS